MADLSKETLAAYDYVDRVVDTADDKKKLMWHGWALRDAFVAGAMWQAAQPTLAVDGAVFCRPQFHVFIDGVCAHCGYDERPATKA